MAMTLREVFLAWQAKQDHEWTQTAEIIAAIYNIRQRGRGDTRTFTGRDFYRASDAKNDRRGVAAGTQITKGLLHALKPMFLKESPSCKSR